MLNVIVKIHIHSCSFSLNIGASNDRGYELSAHYIEFIADKHEQRD